MHRLGVVAVAVILGTTISAQRPSRAAADLAKLGPQVGQRVPNFSLPDQNGTPRTLKSILGPNGAMIVFYRSADW
jgi:cytochrome oxidase Cu insertion factor (SCO1/SenC/PrrC family)